MRINLFTTTILATKIYRRWAYKGGRHVPAPRTQEVSQIFTKKRLIKNSKEKLQIFANF